MAGIADPHHHFVIDTSALLTYVCPKAATTSLARDRILRLVNARTTHNWRNFRLYVPAICIPEAQSKIDEYRLCDWHGPTKTNNSNKLTKKEYKEAHDRLDSLVADREVIQIPQEWDHVLACRLVTPVNAYYKLRRDRGKSNR